MGSLALWLPHLSTLLPQWSLSLRCVWGAVELSIGAMHPDITCSLCLGHLWLSVMVSVCRLVPSTGNLMSILLNKNLLVKLFDHMIGANFNFWKNSHCFPQHCTQAFFHVLPNSDHLSGGLTILTGVRSYSHWF